jgi:glycerol-3-phosphate acyltransferase PlsY
VSIVFVALGWLAPAWLLYVVPGVAIVWVAHRDNIERLLAGTERRVDLGSRSSRGSTRPPA